MALAAIRSVPLKMLPFDNKNELLLVVDLDEGTTLERTDVVVREIESELARVPEVTDFTSYVGPPQPDRLQRPGTPLLPAPDAASGRDPGQPRGQETPRGPEPRPCIAAS